MRAPFASSNSTRTFSPASAVLLTPACLAYPVERLLLHRLNAMPISAQAYALLKLSRGRPLVGMEDMISRKELVHGAATHANLLSVVLAWSPYNKN